MLHFVNERYLGIQLLTKSGIEVKEIRMAFLPPPRQKQQPLGSQKCWAYALSSWMDVTKKRNPTAPEDIVKACKNYLGLHGGLIPAHFHKVFESPFIRMA